MSLDPVTTPVIDTASQGERELRTAAELRSLLASHDLTGLQWAPRIVVQSGVVAHSHPILTLNTRTEGDDLLATFLHEQMHVWISECPGLPGATAETSQTWATVPTAEAGGAGSEKSTRSHLLVCHLERRALQCVAGSSRADAVLRRRIDTGSVYPWVYRQVESHGDVLDRLCSKHDIWPARLAR